MITAILTSICISCSLLGNVDTNKINVVPFLKI
ncbi:hypothetical protein QIA01_04850 (plasmid) [Borreliella americana]